MRLLEAAAAIGLATFIGEGCASTLSTRPLKVAHEMDAAMDAADEPKPIEEAKPKSLIEIHRASFSKELLAALNYSGGVRLLETMLAISAVEEMGDEEAERKDGNPHLAYMHYAFALQRLQVIYDLITGFLAYVADPLEGDPSTVDAAILRDVSSYERGSELRSRLETQRMRLISKMQKLGGSGGIIAK